MFVLISINHNLFVLNTPPTYLKINLDDMPQWLSAQFLETFCLVSNSGFTAFWLCEDGQSVNPLPYNKGKDNTYITGLLREFIL